MLTSNTTNKYQPTLPTITEVGSDKDQETIKPETRGEEFRRKSDEEILAKMMKETDANSRFKVLKTTKKKDGFPRKRNVSKTPAWVNSLGACTEE